MTDEEKQAIEILENKVFNYSLNKKMGLVDKMTEQGRKECEALEIVLNLIEKRQEEIYQNKKMLAISIADRVNSVFEQKNKNDEDLEMLYKGCQIELEEKEKYINKLENKLMYALSPTTHELAITTQEHFKAIVKDKLEEDTYTIKRALKEYWKTFK